MVDSSPKTFNYLCIRETSVRVPKEMASACLLDFNTAAKGFPTHAWPVTVLGHGASNVSYKFRNTLHVAMMQCKDDSAWEAFRLSVYGWTSDQGTERKLADVAIAVPANFENLRTVSELVLAGNIPLAHLESSSCYVWPNALYMPGLWRMQSQGLHSGSVLSKMVSGAWRSCWQTEVSGSDSCPHV